MVKACRVCGAYSNEVDFKPKANICKPCHSSYMTEYRAKNRKKISKQVQDWKDTNREHYKKECREHYHKRGGRMKHFARIQKTPRTWFSHLLSITRANSKSPGPHDPKFGPKRDFDLTLDYVVSLFEGQNGKCAMTGLEMTTNLNDLSSASIDRIDNNLGHIIGNIMIVCRWVNTARRHHTVEEFKEVLENLSEVLQPQI